MDIKPKANFKGVEVRLDNSDDALDLEKGVLPYASDGGGNPFMNILDLPLGIRLRQTHEFPATIAISNRQLKRMYGRLRSQEELAGQLGISERTRSVTEKLGAYLLEVA